MFATGSETAVIAFSDSKAAALYCDFVVPVEMGEAIPVEGSNELGMFDVLPHILPRALRNASSPRGVHPDIIHYVSQYLTAFPQALGIKELPHGETFKERADKRFPELLNALSTMIDNLGPTPIETFGILRPAGGRQEADLAEPAVLLSGLRLVDTQKLSWRHIVEIRRDSDSTRKLRQLKVFMRKELRGKSVAEIEDILLNAVERHQDVCTQWGLETFETVLDAIFSTKSVPALVAGLIGSTMSITAAIAVGAAFEMGGITVNVLKKRRDVRNFRKYDPVSYIVELKERIPNN